MKLLLQRLYDLLILSTVNSVSGARKKKVQRTDKVERECKHVCMCEYQSFHKYEKQSPAGKL